MQHMCNSTEPSIFDIIVLQSNAYITIFMQFLIAQTYLIFLDYFHGFLGSGALKILWGLCETLLGGQMDPPKLESNSVMYFYDYMERRTLSVWN